MWPCSHEAKFCLFCKKLCQQRGISSANEFFFTVQNFLNCHQSSRMPSRRVGNLEFFVRRQSPLFFDSNPSSGHFISHTWSIKVTSIGISGKTKNFACLWCEQGPKKKKNWWVQNFQIFRRHQTLFFAVVRIGPKAVHYSTTDLFLILGGEGGTPLFGL